MADKIRHVDVDGTKYDIQAGNLRIFYGSSSTAAGTQTKAVTISDVTALETGDLYVILMANAQTYNGVPKLKINSLAEKNIVRYGTTNAARYEWNAGEVVTFVYNGTNMVIVEGGIATTTYFGKTKLNSATNSTSTAEAATPSAVKAAYDLANSAVPNTRTVNGKALSSDITLSASDVGAITSTFTGASASAAGSIGLVPAPAKGEQDKYLKGDGTWGAIQAGDTDNTRVFYGTCATAAATQRKDVTISDVTELKAGDVFVITFTYNQNYNGAPTMQINSLGAKNIRRLTGTNAARYEWSDGETIVFVWNGTYFLIANGGFATTTYYGRTKLATSGTSTSTALALTPASLNNLSQNMIAGAAVYSTSATYAVVDRVRYNYQTWECVTAITTAEAWTAAHWKALDPIQTQVVDKIMFFQSVTVSTGTSAEIMRITDSRINTNTVVINCVWGNSSYITSDVTWTTYDGYVTFVGTCTTATTADVTLGNAS